jgi:hypothetical protein
MYRVVMVDQQKEEALVSNRIRSLLVVAMALSTASAPMSALAQAADPAAAASQQPLSPEAMDKLVAPVALYPDALIIQIVQCAGSPYQVRQVNDWLKQNPTLKGTAAQDAASQQGFDASFVAIILFPQVLQTMADQPDWTRDLGRAFQTDKDAVFASIQRLRAQAQSVGNLETNQQQKVDTVTTDSGQQVIVIQPANPQVVYVPQYNPQVVYTQPAPTTTTQSDSNALAAGLIGFAAGVIVGAAADNDNDHYYYACGGWGYARPICYSGGYNDYYQHRENMANDYYDHRENMANDYYDHRENMAGQAGQNQANRQAASSTNQAARQDSRATAQTTAAGNQDSRQTNRADTQATASQDRSANQAQRQSAYAGAGQSSAQAAAASADRSASASRGSFQSTSGASTQRDGTQSGAFSGYQRGSTERASSSRGQSSMSRSGGGRR